MRRARNKYWDNAYSPLYLRYMRSERWYAKRREALRFHGAFCHDCGTAAGLQIHHLTYKRLGRELMEDLVPLCRPCHDLRHGFVRQPRICISVPQFSTADKRRLFYTAVATLLVGVVTAALCCYALR